MEEETQAGGQSPSQPWESAAQPLGEAAVGALSGIIDGADADMQKFASEMVVSLGVAKASGDPERVRRIAEQFKILGESQRLRASQAGWELAFGFLEGMVEAAAIGARTLAGGRDN